MTGPWPILVRVLTILEVDSALKEEINGWITFMLKGFLMVKKLWE